jgi:RHS repeat-associated protein
VRVYPGDPAENVTYVYDQPGAGFGIGRLTEVTDEAGRLLRRYDERGNMLDETRALGTATFNTAYRYDAANRLASITYPSGWAAGYSRDAMGRITAVAATPPGGVAVPVAGSIAYQPFGPLAGLVYGNGIGETRDYDLDYRLTKLKDAGKSASRIASYGYNAADDVLSIADNLFGTQGFTYDALDRLKSASGFYGKLQFRYDLVGNLLRTTNGSAMTHFVYAARSNRLTELDTGGAVVRHFDYWPSGNIKFDQQSSTTITLGYNQDNRLATIKNQPKSGSTASYKYYYDAFGRRLEKERLGSGGIETAFQYDLSGHLLEERDLAGGTSRTDYIYLGDRPIAMITPGGTLAFYETGLLDTPQALTGASQAALSSADYQPFGQTRILVGGIAQNLRFPGQYADAETGYYHNGFRDYDPSLGRYLETDPIGLAGGLNTYAYASNDPISGIDPSGLQMFQGGVEYDELAAGTSGYDEFATSGPTSCGTSTFATAREGAWPPLQALSDISTGAGDIVSFGAQRWIRRFTGSIGVVDTSSLAYALGERAGWAFNDVIYRRAAATIVRDLTGPLERWFRINPSYSQSLQRPTNASLRLGSNNYYRQQIPNVIYQNYNQILLSYFDKLRHLVHEYFPSWRTADKNHIHLY